MKNPVKTLAALAALASLSIAPGCMSASAPASGDPPDMARKYAAALERIDGMRDELAKKDAEIAAYAKKFRDLSAKFDDMSKRWQDMGERYADLSKRYDAQAKKFQDQEQRFNALAKRFQEQEQRFREVSAKLKALLARAETALTNECGRANCGKASVSE